MTEDEHHRLDCLARWLLAQTRDQAIATWRRWQEPGSARKSPEFLADMRRRLHEQRQAKT